MLHTFDVLIVTPMRGSFLPRSYRSIHQTRGVFSTVLLNTRTGKGGASPHVFCEYLSKYSFDRRDFFSTCPKINGAPFGAKIEDSSILGGLF